MRASDLLGSEEELSSLIDAAARLARGDWEKQFTQDIGDKFQRYGLGMYLSEKQLEILRRIGGLSGRQHRAPNDAQPSKAATEIDKKFLRQLTQLCHPDKHSQSPLSVEVTQRLNALRSSL